MLFMNLLVYFDFGKLHLLLSLAKILNIKYYLTPLLANTLSDNRFPFADN